MYDIDKMRRIVENTYVRDVREKYGAEGTASLVELTEFLVQLYRRIDPSSRRDPLMVCRAIGGQSIPFIEAPTHSLQSIAHIQHHLDGPCCIEVLGSGALHVYPLGSVSISAASERAVVYRFGAGEERLFVKDASFALINPLTELASVFARPTFSSLQAALANFAVRMRDSSCEIVKGVWADPKRLFFKIKPEMTMRKSLNNFLSNVLQDAEVRPEQNVDESHPVDVKVSWVYSDQRALIEIKWMGDSRDPAGNVTTKYRDARANEGAKQLADYLDKANEWAPGVRVRGHLVVLDGRRKALAASNSAISTSDGLHYRDLEVTYSPDYAASRTDFAPPSRMFMAPICDP